MSSADESAREARPGRPPVDAAGATPPPPPPGYMPMAYGPPPKQRGGALAKIATSVFTTLLIFSVVLNIWLGTLVAGLTAGPSEGTYLEGDASQRIVILPVEGLIDEATHHYVRESLLALRDDLPKALILRVDSGGGYVSPSDRIWHEIVRFKQETGIPVVASFGGTAASGGYYIAAPADAIVAEPTSITGSIGVIAQAFTVQDLLDKVGVTPEVIASTDSTKKDMLNPMRAWTEQDRDKLRTILDRAHEQFVDVVYQGRKNTLLNREGVMELATGEVFTARTALANGLIDEVGYLEEAIDLAAKRAGLDPAVQPQVTRMRRPQPFGLMGMLKSDTPSISSVTGEQLRNWMLELSAPRMMYQAPVR